MKRILSQMFVPVLLLGGIACDSEDDIDDADRLAEASPADAAQPDCGRRHGPPDPDRILAAHDADGDGSLSAVEVGQTPLARHFGEVDADGNGTISREELAAAEPPHGKKRRGHPKDPKAAAAHKLAKYDTDGDGAISVAEAGDSRLAGHFAAIDGDADGKLTLIELESWKAGHRRHGCKDGVASKTEPA